MGDTILEFSKLGRVPALRGTDEVAGDALEAVDIRTATLRTDFHVRIRILIATLHAAVAVVVHRTVAHIEAVHHIDHAHDGRRIVGGIAIDLDVEDMTTTREVVVRSLHLGLVKR